VRNLKKTSGQAASCPRLELYTFESKSYAPVLETVCSVHVSVGVWLQKKRFVPYACLFHVTMPLVTVCSPCRPNSIPGVVLVGFVVQKVGLGQVYVRALRFSLQVSLHPRCMRAHHFRPDYCVPTATACLGAGPNIVFSQLFSDVFV
jgi:hypothetical protein